MAKKKESSLSQDRGKFLTAVIVIFFLMSLYLIFEILIDFNGWKESIASEPSWYMSYYLISMVVDLVSLYGLWMFKKWGAYLFFASFIIGILVMLISPDPSLNHPFIQIFLGVILALFIGLPLWAIKRKWHLFK